VEKQVFPVAHLDEPESLVCQLFDRAFGHCSIPRFCFL
jgi:hypothetical protein